jgi:hypothetical protein
MSHNQRDCGNSGKVWKASHILDAEEVSGSNPLSPTLIYPANTKESLTLGLEPGGFVHQPSSDVLENALAKVRYMNLDVDSQNQKAAHLFGG